MTGNQIDFYGLFRPTCEFANCLLSKLCQRLPNAGTTINFYNIVNYFDPYSRGILLEKKFRVMEETKRQILLTQPDALNSIATQPVPEIDEDNPLEKLLREKTACQSETLSLSPIEIEMQQYESLPRVGKDMDVREWWFQNSKKFPILFEGAKHYGERFSQIVTIGTNYHYWD